MPKDSRLLAIIRGGVVMFPRGDDVLRDGDLVVVIGSPQAAREWSALLWPGRAALDDVVVFGGGQVGTAIARTLCREGIGVRMIEPNLERAREIAEQIPRLPGLQLRRDRRGLPRARARRRGPGGRVRDARGREEPLRRDARARPRRPLHDRDRARLDLAGGLRARRHRRHVNPRR